MPKSILEGPEYLLCLYLDPSRKNVEAFDGFFVEFAPIGMLSEGRFPRSPSPSSLSVR